MKHCEIPRFEIQDIKKIKLRREPLPNCDPHQFLTSIISTTSISDPLHLLIHSEHFEHYKVSSVECCFQNIFRVEGSDDKVSFSRNCTPFINKHNLDKKTAQLYVKCSSDGKEVFSNVHAIISRKKEFEDRQIEAKIDKRNAYKVVIFGQCFNFPKV